MGKQKADRKQVIADFSKLRSYTLAGRLNHITRQRVEQIILASDCPVKCLTAHFQYLNSPCRECHRKMDGKKIKSGSNDYCKACYNYHNQLKTGHIKKHNLFRHYNYPKKCVICGTRFTKSKPSRSQGRCSKCYEKYDERRKLKCKGYQEKYLAKRCLHHKKATRVDF